MGSRPLNRMVLAAVTLTVSSIAGCDTQRPGANLPSSSAKDAGSQGPSAVPDVDSLATATVRCLSLPGHTPVDLALSGDGDTLYYLSLRPIEPEESSLRQMMGYHAPYLRALYVVSIANGNPIELAHETGDRIAVARDGSLVYLRNHPPLRTPSYAESSETSELVVWKDDKEQTLSPRAHRVSFRLAPNGTTLHFATNEAGFPLYSANLPTQKATRIGAGVHRVRGHAGGKVIVERSSGHSLIDPTTMDRTPIPMPPGRLHQPLGKAFVHSPLNAQRRVMAPRIFDLDGTSQTIEGATERTVVLDDGQKTFIALWSDNDATLLELHEDASTTQRLRWRGARIRDVVTRGTDTIVAVQFDTNVDGQLGHPDEGDICIVPLETTAVTVSRAYPHARQGVMRKVASLQRDDLGTARTAMTSIYGQPVVVFTLATNGPSDVTAVKARALSLLSSLAKVTGDAELGVALRVEGKGLEAHAIPHPAVQRPIVGAGTLGNVRYDASVFHVAVRAKSVVDGYRRDCQGTVRNTGSVPVRPRVRCVPVNLVSSHRDTGTDPEVLPPGAEGTFRHDAYTSRPTEVEVTIDGAVVPYFDVTRDEAAAQKKP